ncbi:type II restriction endonuclease [Sphingobacteriales bacterium CHB3]|nr:type II restriction endonuclease [Sphingobacteriales bacterium CHB3]
MFTDPNSLAGNVALLEDIEKASTRFVAQAIELFRPEAVNIFAEENDLQADIGEDITAEALDSLGMSRMAQRVFGKMDYKRARYIFEADHALRQVLLVDSKAEKTGGVARLQTSQTSMRIRQVRQGKSLDVQGTVPKVAVLAGVPFITTTIFVKYVYKTVNGANVLQKIVVACCPNGFLQEYYNPTSTDTIWVGGPNAPTLGEVFRTRLSFARLKAKRNWRVQTICIEPAAPFAWDD